MSPEREPGARGVVCITGLADAECFVGWEELVPAGLDVAELATADVVGQMLDVNLDPRTVGWEQVDRLPRSSQTSLVVRCCCSDRSNFGEALDCELVGPAGVPADGGFPCGRCLRGNVVRVVVETGGVVWQHQV